MKSWWKVRVCALGTRALERSPYQGNSALGSPCAILRKWVCSEGAWDASSLTVGPTNTRFLGIFESSRRAGGDDDEER